MKTISLFFLVFVVSFAGGFTARALAAEGVFVTIAGTQYTASRIEGANLGTVTAELMLGGLGDVPLPLWAGRIILIDRGGFPIRDKVSRAASVGAIGVVIANTNDDPEETATILPNTSPIPALFVRKSTGDFIRAKPGSVARIGTAAPPGVPAGIIVPDPTGTNGLLLMTKDGKYVLGSRAELPPQITSASDVELGKSLGFTVTAEGSSPFTYQWIKNGANLPGETNAVLFIASVKAEDAGSYSCQVSNIVGSAVSGAHIITVK